MATALTEQDTMGLSYYLARSGLPAVSRKNIVFFKSCNKSFIARLFGQEG